MVLVHIYTLETPVGNVNKKPLNQLFSFDFYSQYFDLDTDEVLV